MIFHSWRLMAEVLLWTNCVFISAYVVHGKIFENKVIDTSIESKHKFFQRPAVKSIQSSDGDVIDCVDIYKQPTFDDPLFLNHTIQMRPSLIPNQNSKDDKNKFSSNKTMVQVWQKNGSCPKGTIPIRRVRKQDLKRFHILDTFGKKNQHVLNGSDEMQNHNNCTLMINNSTVLLEYQPNHAFVVLVATVTHFVGSRGALNVWNPRIESQEEYTTSQIWLMAGGSKDYESVESGWMVNPKLYGDTQTRFFIHWTKDGSQKTGCYDLLCSGFIQTSHEYALGAAISPLSYEGGAQYQIAVQISMDAKTGNWWLRLNDKVDLGYFPPSLFTYMRAGATLTQWGGDVYSPKVKHTPHTTTAMGSGNWPEDLFGWASYIAHIRTMDYSYMWRYPQYVGISSDEPDCYAAFHYVPGFMEEPTLFFGGPGGFQNPRCP